MHFSGILSAVQQDAAQHQLQCRAAFAGTDHLVVHLQNIAAAFVIHRGKQTLLQQLFVQRLGAIHVPHGVRKVHIQTVGGVEIFADAAFHTLHQLGDLLRIFHIAQALSIHFDLEAEAEAAGRDDHHGGGSHQCHGSAAAVLPALGQAFHLMPGLVQFPAERFIFQQPAGSITCQIGDHSPQLAQQPQHQIAQQQSQPAQPAEDTGHMAQQTPQLHGVGADGGQPAGMQFELYPPGAQGTAAPLDRQRVRVNR